MLSTALLKVKDVAAILGISQSSAYRLMQTEIPSVRFGRTVRVRPEDLEKFIAERIASDQYNSPVFQS